ncbi:MAG: hypothetical protein WCF84_21005 [Anaerolineae bacterium]
MDLDSQLAQLVNAQLLRPLAGLESAYQFKHALTQETSYQSLLMKKRREIHRRVAEAYEQVYAGSLDEYAALLAQHYAEAGEDAKTLKYARQAGDAAARIHANTEAVAHYSLAIDIARRAPRVDCALLTELYLERGRSLELLSRLDRALENYDEMERVAREHQDREFELSALIARATVRSIPGAVWNVQEADLLSAQALQLARELGNRQAESKILWGQLMRNVYSGGDTHEALALGQESLRIAREFNLREQEAFTLHDLLVAYSYVGDLASSRRVGQEAEALWREMDNKPLWADSLIRLAVLDAMTGELEQAEAQATRGNEICISIGNLGGQGFSGYIRCLVQMERGNPAGALASLQPTLEMVEMHTLEGAGIDACGEQAWICALLGDTDRARQLVTARFSRLQGGMELQPVWLYALLARIELLAGNVAAADTALRSGHVAPTIEDYQRTFPLGASVLFLAAAEVALSLKNPAQAIQILDAFLEYAQSVGIRWSVPEALCLKGEALYAEGQVDAALAVWRSAAEQAQAMAAHANLWPILVALYKAERDRGNAIQADSLLNQALLIVRSIADRTPEELRRSFLATPRIAAVFAPLAHL